MERCRAIVRATERMPRLVEVVSRVELDAARHAEAAPYADRGRARLGALIDLYA